MHAHKLITINWGHAESREFDLGHINMFTGGSGSGKTTTADAFQTIMTAARQGVFAFNPGQNESTQRGKWGKQPRTLESYILGAEEGGIFMRPNGAHGYVAISFMPSPSEPNGELFTALVAISATLDKSNDKRVPRRNRLHLVIIEGHELSIDDLIFDRQGNNFNVVPVEQIIKNLAQKFGSNAIRDHRDNKISYLQHLYGMLRGRRTVSQDEALQAAKSFSRFMAYHPVEDIDAFVRNEVLERRDLGEEIEHISLMMRDISHLKDESDRLSQNIHLLEEARELGNEYRQAWIEEKEHALLEALCQRGEQQQQQEQFQEQIGSVDQEMVQFSQQIDGLQRTLQDLEDKRRSLDSKRLQSDTARTKDELSRKRHEQLQKAAETLAQLGQSLSQLQQFKTQIETLADSETLLSPLLKQPISFDKIRQQAASVTQLPFAELNKKLSQLASNENLDISLCASLSTELSQLEQAQKKLLTLLQEGDTALGSALEAAIATTSHEHSDVQGRLRQLSERLDWVRQSGGVDYPRGVSLALEALNEDLPQAQAQVLCDLVEINEAEWQGPIESYIGGNRFNIIVKPEYEALATALVGKTKGARAKVIQSQLAQRDAESMRLPQNSIFQLMTIEQPQAHDYLKASYGMVEMTRDTEALKRVKRGITKDGHGSANYTMFSCQLPESELTFGKQARAQRLKLSEEKLLELNQQAQKLEQQQNALQRLLRILLSLQVIEFSRPTSSLQQSADSIHSLDEAITQLDTSSISELEEELTKLNQQWQSLEQQRAEVLRNEGRAQQQREHLCAELAQLDTLAEKSAELIQDRQLELNKVLEFRRDYNLPVAVKDIEDEAQETDKSTAEIRRDIDKSVRQQQKLFDTIKETLVSYNQATHGDEQIQFQATEGNSDRASMIDSLLAQVRSQLKQQRDNSLAAVESRLNKAKHSVHNAFTASFCQRLYSAIDDGERILRNLNHELEFSQFGDDKFSFGWEWVPQYKRYYKFFKTVIQTEGLTEDQDLFELELNKDDSRVRDEIMELLLSQDRQKAEARLTEISDYRNYRRYEIFKHTNNGEPIRLSEYGTGSGGQLETPAYVIRAAAISSAFKFREGEHHLRSVIIDESFAKMDEIRARSVIDYLSKKLNLQVLFIMPSKSAGAFKDMVDHEYVFSKVTSAQAMGELNTTTFVNHIVMNKDALTKAWEAYRQDVRKQAEIEFLAEGM